jgi:HD superfamily phosphohydrolase YqeK
VKDADVEKLELPKLTHNFRKIVDQTKFLAIINNLKNKECLIIVDNSQEVLHNDEEQFCKFFETLMKHCPNV